MIANSNASWYPASFNSMHWMCRIRTGVAVVAGAGEAAVGIGAAGVLRAACRATHALVDVDVARRALVPAAKTIFPHTFTQSNAISD